MDEKINILLIEDSPDDAFLIQEMLAQAGREFELARADRLSTGLARLAEDGVDVVLLDLGLPDSQGLKTFVKVCAQAPDVPIVVLTGLDDEELAVEAVAQGAQDYLVKGQVEGHLLARAIRYAIERKRMEQREKHLTAVLRAVRNVNQLIVQEKDRNRLLQGACDNLIETRGYISVWIALIDGSGKPALSDAEGFLTAAEAGLGEVFLPLVERLERGELPYCAQKALAQPEVLIVEDPPSVCADCPLSGSYRDRGGMTIRLEHGEKVYGLLAVSIPMDFVADTEEHSLFKEVAGDIAFALHGMEVAEARERVEESLRESEERLRRVVQNMPVMLDAVDADNNLIVWNRECQRVTGYSAEEMVGNPKALELLYPDAAYLQQMMAEWSERGNDFRDWEIELTAKDGRVKTVAWSNISEQFPIPGWAAWSIGVDVTERVRAEEERALLIAEIREQAHRVQQIINTVPEGVLLLSAAGQVILANPVAKKDLVALADARVGDTLTRLGARSLAEVLTSPPKGLWHEVTAGSRRFEVIARPMENGPQTSGWVLVVRDVTHEREIQQNIQQQERLAAVGQLAAGIAHDFNNIMAVIVLYAGTSLRTPDLAPDVRKRLETISEQAKRAIDLIQQILDFGRRAVLERLPMDLLPFLKEQVKLLERTIPENIRIDMTYGTGEHTIHADPTRIQQAIMNLAVNARDAMTLSSSVETPEGGELCIRLERIQIEDSKDAPLPDMEAGEWVRLAVSDTGTGIPADVLPHIFDPFFTTKAPGQGTGLGLAQVWGIVKQHGGHIDVATKVGEGTTFTLYLPALLEHQPEAPTLKTEDLVRGQGETILVVEDNARTREALVDTLELLNYRVLTAKNGREALTLFERHPEEIALVLTDAVMPEMGGIALFHALKQRELAVPVVILTGHTMEKELEDLQVKGLDGRLLKPPSLEQLAEVVARVLKKGRDSGMDTEPEGL